jgi:hypothetical protein
MSGPFPIKRGDTNTPIIGRLRDGKGVLVPLPPGTQVFFAMAPAVAGLPGATFKKAGYIVESPGRVGYALEAEDVAIAGPYHAEWEVILPGGPQTFPSDGYLDIVIVPDLG